MKQITIKDNDLSQAAQEGMDAFVGVFVGSLRDAIGGELTSENITQLNADQVTLPLIFKNPFAKALNKMWGMRELGKRIYEVHTLYNQYHEPLERECSDEEFMALFEQYPEFDDYDDWFVEHEEELTAHVARYLDENIDKFATIV